MSGAGDCYEAAVETFMNMDAAVRPFTRLCHGVVTGNAEPVVGVRFGHAWLEIGGAVIDNSNGNETVTPEHRYYERASIAPSEVVRYDYYAMASNLLTFQHYGPWHEDGVDK